MGDTSPSVGRRPDVEVDLYDSVRGKLVNNPEDDGVAQILIYAAILRMTKVHKCRFVRSY